MSTVARHPLPGEPARSSSDVRLSVEQVSYAYAPNPSQAPLFTLEATSFQAKPGELISSQELAATRSDRVWVVEMAGGYWGDFQVPVPADWVEMNREEFPEVYWLQGNLYVAEYRIPRGS